MTFAIRLRLYDQGQPHIHTAYGMDEQKFSDFKKDFKTICSNPRELEETTERIFDVLLDEITLELIFESHRSAKIGIELDDNTVNDEDNQISSTTDEKQKKSQDCMCPICNRLVDALRFAPHLEHCMGLGRKRSRNANRMLNNDSNKERGATYGGMASDDEEEADWNTGNKRKRKKNNNRIKKPKNSPKKNGDSAMELSLQSYDHLNGEEKKALLNKFCGVVSEHTRKICSRSLKCNLHSDEKRKALRIAIISELEGTELMNVDVEGDDDMDSASLKDLMQDNSNTSSPADSASNSNSSSSSKKPEKTGKVKTKNSKKDRSSPNVSLPIE